MVKSKPLPTRAPDREKAILAAARQEFIAKGLSGGRMQAIATCAGVNKALLHYYYRSKDGLYAAALADILRNLWQALRAEMTAQPPNQDVRSLVHMVVATYINTISENADFARFFLRELADGGGMLPEILKGFVASFDDVLSQMFAVIKKSQKAGAIRPVSPVHLAMNILGMCVATFIARFIFESVPRRVKLGISFDRRFYDERIQEITEMALNGIVVKGELS
jgi:TetR/AcrR family transcriptional regulator